MKSMFCALFVLSSAFISAAQSHSLSEQMAATAMTRVWADSPNGPGIPPKWVYDFGVEANGLMSLWLATGDVRYYNHIKKGVDAFVEKDGSIKTYNVGDYNLDQVRMGAAALMLYRVAGEAK